MLTDEEEQADQAIRQNAQKLSGIIDRHKKELNLPGVVGIYQVWADPYHQWIRVMVKELTLQLEHQLPSELEGAWVQVVDKTRYDDAKQVIDANTHRLFHPRISRRSPAGPMREQ